MTLIILQTIIIISYLIIALQFFYAVAYIPKEKLKGKALKAMMLKMGIFILCAISGYASHLFYFPLIVNQISHFLLAIVSVCYVFLGQSFVLSKAFYDDGEKK